MTGFRFCHLMRLVSLAGLPELALSQIAERPFLGTDSSRYLIIWEDGIYSGGKTSIRVDYGQRTSFFEKENLLRDQTGQPLRFYSMADALNYFDRLGFELVSTYGGNRSEAVRFVLRRKNEKKPMN
jgi:hypothetical protein